MGFKFAGLPKPVDDWILLFGNRAPATVRMYEGNLKGFCGYFGVSGDNFRVHYNMAVMIKGFLKLAR
jgi:hypothetical protein